MKSIYVFLLASMFFLSACNGIIKNDNPKIIEEEGTKVSTAVETKRKYKFYWYLCWHV